MTSNFLSFFFFLPCVEHATSPLHLVAEGVKSLPLYPCHLWGILNRLNLVALANGGFEVAK